MVHSLYFAAVAIREWAWEASCLATSPIHDRSSINIKIEMNLNELKNFGLEPRDFGLGADGLGLGFLKFLVLREWKLDGFGDLANLSDLLPHLTYNTPLTSYTNHTPKLTLYRYTPT